LRGLAARIDLNDPSRMLPTENRRAKQITTDFDAILKKIMLKVEEQKATSPNQIGAIVESELKTFDAQTKAKFITWVQDTQDRAVFRADILLKASGLKVGLALGPTGIPQATKDIININVNNDIENLTSSMKAKITSALIEGMDAGKAPRVIAKEISESTAVERTRAELIARTETMKAFNRSAESQYKRHDVQNVKWLAAQDERTCDECGAYDGQEYPIDSHPDCPAHPRCRCVLLPVIPEVGA
jgi:SPP1 gp7 family putative phage head morphogenesis protein